MSNTVNKIFVDKMGGRSTSDYIGIEGDLFYDPAVGELRISDGITGGGKSLTNSSNLGVYRTFQAGANIIRNTGETDMAQIIIHNAPGKVDYINFTDNTDNDDFYTTGLLSQYWWGWYRNANKIIMLNVYGSRTGALNDSDLRYFVRKFIDTVLFDQNDNEVNNLDEAKARFYDNFEALKQSLPDNALFENFSFDDGLRYHYPEYTATGNNTTAQFALKMYGRGGVYYDQYNSEDVYLYNINSGENYSVGDVITVKGSQLGGVDSTNDMTLTVTALRSGHITGLVMNDGGSNFRPAWQFSNSVTLNGGSGNGARIHIESVNAAGIIVSWSIQECGQNYTVGDILTANFGGNDCVFEVTAVGTDGIREYNLSGTGYYGSPARVPNGYWPKLSIDDGGADQYDWGNQISSNASTSSAIATINNGVLTIQQWLKEGTTPVQEKSVVWGKTNDGPPWYGWIMLINQATDDSNVWYIDGDYTNGTYELRFDSLEYGNGNVVNNSAFNVDGTSNYVTVYDKGVFAMMAFNTFVDSVYYNGNSGADSYGFKEIITLMGANADNYQLKMVPQVRVYGGTYYLKESDIGKHIYGANDVVIPPQASVNFPIGTAITVVSPDAWTYIYADNGDVTQVWGAGFNQTNNSFYIPNNSVATIVKIDHDKWMLSGAGLAID